MFLYVAKGDLQDKMNPNAFFGGYGGWEGRWRVTGKVPGNALARANLNGLYLSDATVDSGTLTQAKHLAFISGLTYCVGVALAVRPAGHNNFSDVSVAHYNGGWDRDDRWADLRNGVNVAAGRLYGFIILTSDSTVNDRLRVIDEFRPRMQNAQVADDDIVCYHSSKSGVVFAVCYDGSVGEPDGNWPTN